MTLAEYVKSLAIRIGLLEKGGSGGDVTKEYVDSQDTKLGNRITNLNTKVNGIRSDLTDAQGDIVTLQSDVNVLQGDVTTLKDDVENIMDAIPSKTSELVNDSGFITASDTIDKAMNDENGDNIANQFSAINNALDDVGNAFGKLGTAISSTYIDQYVPNDVGTNLRKVTLPANGAFLVVGSGAFQANSAGMRTLLLSTNPNIKASLSVSDGKAQSYSGSTTDIKVFTFTETTVQTDIYLSGYQNSGNQLNVQAGMYAIRLR